MIMNMEPDALVEGLKAAGDQTRLRLLCLCGMGDMSVGDLVEILEQSQPSISRHLKILHGAGLLERRQDGAFVFYRIPPSGLAQKLVALMNHDNQALAEDRAGYARLEQARHEAIAQHFANHASEWDELRGSYLSASEVDQLLSSLVAKYQPEHVLDIGTGTGHVLGITGAKAKLLAGVDISRDMLSLARQRLAETANGKELDLRRADMGQLPFDDNQFDLASMHLVLRHAANPERALREAARTLKPGGILAVLDLAAGAIDGEGAHRSGFHKDEVPAFFEAAHLHHDETVELYQGSLKGFCWQASKI